MANGSQFSIDVVAALNTDNVPKQLDELNARLTKTTSNMVKIPIGIDENGKRVFGEFLKDVRTYKDELNNLYKRQTITNPFSGMVKSDSLKKITDSVKTLTTETHKWTNSKGEINEWATTVDSAGQVVSKRTKQYVDETNNLVKETTSWTRNSQGQWEQVGDTIRNISDNVKNATTVLSTETHKWTSTNGDINKWVTTVDDAGNVVSNRTKQYKNDIGELVTETSKWTKNSQGQWQQVGETIKTVTDDFKQSTNIISTETHKFVDSQGAVQTWVTTIDDAGKRVSTRTKEIVDGMGNVTQVTQRFEAEAGKPFKKVGDDIVKVSEILQEATTTTSTTVGQITDTINGVERTFEGTITTIKKVSSNGEELTTVISKYNDDLGRTIEKTEQFNKAGDRVATTMRKISEATPATNTETKTWIDKNGVKTVEQYSNGILQLTTRTREYVNQNKELVTETTQLEGAERRLISTHTERSRNIQKETEELNKEIDATFRLRNALISTTTTTSRGRVEQFGAYDHKKYDALITKIERVDAANKKVIETTYEFTNAQGQLVRQTRVTDAEGKKLAEDTIQISNAQKQASNSTNNATQSNQRYTDSTRRAAKETKTFGQSLTDALARLARYYLASLPIQAVRKAISEAITTVKEFDNALIEFRKVSDLAGESLERYVANLAEVGQLTGSTMQAMVEASTEFRKSGFSDEDSATLASVAEMYRNVADEEISAADSASFIIAQMKAFNIEANDSMHIIDAVNEVANHFAVSSADLAGNLGKVSASLSVNGTKFEEVLGMMTAVTEVTRNASTASRGLSMISSRLVQVLDESSSTGKKLTKIYKDLNIALTDENGQMRGTYDILKDLADRWNTLTSDQQKYIALTSAGARQTQNFVALMKNFDQAIEATEMAYNSTNSAAKENEKVMDSVAKKTEILRSKFQQIVIGRGGLQDFAKNILDIGIGFLEFTKKIGGLSTILKPLIAIFVSLNAIKIAQWFMNVLNGVKNLIYALPNAISAWRAYKANIVSANTAMQASVPLIGLVVTALSIATSALDNYIQKQKEQKQAILDSISGYIEESKNIDNLIQQVKNENLTREELNNIVESNLDHYDNEYLKLLNINDAREKTIELLEEEEKKRRQELISTGQVAYEEALERQTNGVGNWRKVTRWGEFFSNLGKIATFQKTSSSPESRKDRIKHEAGATVYDDDGWLVPVGSIDEQIRKLEEYRNQLLTERMNLDSSSKEYEEYQQKIQDTIDVINEFKEQRDTDTATIKAYNEALADEGKYYDQNTHKIKELSEEGKRRAQLAKEQENAASSYDKEVEELEELAEQYNVTNEEVAKYIEEHEGVSWEDAVSYLIDEKIAAEEDAMAIKEMAKALGISEEALLANADAMGLSVEVYYEYASAIKASDAALDDLQSSYETLSSAVDEYNESQTFSLDTVQALLQLKPEYLACLIEENGQLSLNETAIMNIAKSMIEERKQLVLSVAYSRLKALEAGEVASAADSQADSVYGSADALDSESKSLSENTIQQYANALARDDRKKQADAAHIVNEMKKELSILEKLGDSIGSLGSKGAKSGKQRAGGSKEATDALKQENKELNDLKSKYDKVITFITGRIDKQIKAIQKAKDEEIKAIEATIKAKEKEKDRALDNIEKQINALEKEKDAREKYWDDQIDALKKANDERKDALELQEKLDALERAKNTKVKVYKEGQGFVYDVDQTAVAEAQKALDEYLSEKAYEDELERLESLKDAEIDNYNKRLDALNAYKDRVQESYEKQIEALNAHKEALEEQYDAQIEYYNNFKDKFEEMVKAYEDSQTALLAKELTGIDFEKDNWMTRLDNLAEFVNKYNALQQQLDTGNTSATNDANMKTGSTYTGSVGSVGGTTTPQKTPIDVTYMSPSERERMAREGNKIVMGKADPQYKARVLHQKVNGHANGVSSIANDEIALVGENPNQELVIGSKINNGQLMSLNKGTGVVNADSSRTLAGLLNQVGQFGASGFGSGNGTLNSNINNDTLTINGVTIQGANINDPQTFVNGLLNLKAEALQRAYRHR